MILGWLSVLRHFRIQLQSSFENISRILSFLQRSLSISSSTNGIETLEIKSHLDWWRPWKGPVFIRVGRSFNWWNVCLYEEGYFGAQLIRLWWLLQQVGIQKFHPFIRLCPLSNVYKQAMYTRHPCWSLLNSMTTQFRVFRFFHRFFIRDLNYRDTCFAEETKKYQLENGKEFQSPKSPCHSWFKLFSPMNLM